MKVLKRILIGLVVIVLAVLGLFWAVTFHPSDTQTETVTCPPETPTLQSEQTIKIMTWNVQYMAGKKYTFWYDVPTNDGPDERPAADEITLALQEVARVIQAENPDVIYLQEVDKGAARTDYRDELAELLKLIPAYPCHVQTYYWKAAYVPHPRIHGAVGLTLVTLSKFKINAATRYQLVLPPSDLITQQFGVKRAILDTSLPVSSGNDFHAINAHLDAFAQGSNTMELQVKQVDERLSALDLTNSVWVIGGDFNLLPPGDAARERIPLSHQSYYNPKSEIELLYNRYNVVPSRAEIDGPDFAKWYTYLPSDPEIPPNPDSTLDYLFYSKLLALDDHYIRSGDTRTISDHMPMIAIFTLP